MPDRIALIIAGRTDVLDEAHPGRTSACADGVRRRWFAVAGRLAMKSPGYRATPHEWGLEPDLSGVA
jgi:hypothetical protein